MDAAYLLDHLLWELMNSWFVIFFLDTDCQNMGAAYLWMRLTHECLQYMSSKTVEPYSSLVLCISDSSIVDKSSWSWELPWTFPHCLPLIRPTKLEEWILKVEARWEYNVLALRCKEAQPVLCSDWVFFFSNFVHLTNWQPAFTHLHVSSYWW